MNKASIFRGNIGRSVLDKIVTFKNAKSTRCNVMLDGLRCAELCSVAEVKIVMI